MQCQWTQWQNVTRLNETDWKQQTRSDQTRPDWGILARPGYMDHTTYEPDQSTQTKMHGPDKTRQDQSIQTRACGPDQTRPQDTCNWHSIRSNRNVTFKNTWNWNYTLVQQYITINPQIIYDFPLNYPEQCWGNALNYTTKLITVSVFKSDIPIRSYTMTRMGEFVIPILTSSTQLYQGICVAFGALVTILWHIIHSISHPQHSWKSGRTSAQRWHGLPTKSPLIHIAFDLTRNIHDGMW